MLMIHSYIRIYARYRLGCNDDWDATTTGSEENVYCYRKTKREREREREREKERKRERETEIHRAYHGANSENSIRKLYKNPEFSLVAVAFF